MRWGRNSSADAVQRFETQQLRTRPDNGSESRASFVVGTRLLLKHRKIVFISACWFALGSLQPVIYELPSLRSTSSATRILTKSRVAQLAIKHFGSDRTSSLLECTPGFDYELQSVLSSDPNHPYYGKDILKQYSTDHFPLGEWNECHVPVSRIRVQYFLHQLTSRDGGTFQCPEVGDLFELIAQHAPDGTVFCEAGFNTGSSATIFLHGSYGRDVQVHSFDVQFPNGTVDFLNDIYSAPRAQRLFPHVGDIRVTIPSLLKSKTKCDVWFLDASIGKVQVDLARMSSNPGALVLYHWLFRNKDCRDDFMQAIHKSHSFVELGCVKTLCALTHTDVSQRVIRESCFGKFPGLGRQWWYKLLV